MELLHNLVVYSAQFGNVANWKEAGLNKVSSILLKIFASNEEWEKYWKERMDLNQKVMLSFKLQKHLCH